MPTAAKITVTKIIETALYVADLQRAANFYRNLFSFETLSESERLVALDVAGQSVLLLFPAGRTTNSVTIAGGTIPGHGSPHTTKDGANPGHLAFAIDTKDVDDWKSHLAAHSTTLESEVTWPTGAKSLYFRDLDQNLVELLTAGFWRIF
jgi:catechol 2,3-dioxygenase-like lactoylglutathione lyase family enzyme